jgi:hypothetical protein
MSRLYEKYAAAKPQPGGKKSLYAALALAEPTLATQQRNKKQRTGRCARPATTKSKGNAMENVSLPENVSADERAKLEAVAVALVTVLTPLCKAIVDEYLRNLNVSVNLKQWDSPTVSLEHRFRLTGEKLEPRG